jgi:methylthioribose-1-phosphate isomerase
MVYADETRPYLQGSRLTVFELQKDKIPVTLTVDSQAAYLMQKKMIDAVFVGADRVAANGDVANKVGTYGLSVLAKAHRIPFFVVAPKSTFDASIETGEKIVVEERSPNEVLEIAGRVIAPKVPVVNYSFDITPAANITAIFSEDDTLE